MYATQSGQKREREGEGDRAKEQRFSCTFLGRKALINCCCCGCCCWLFAHLFLYHARIDSHGLALAVRWAVWFGSVHTLSAWSARSSDNPASLQSVQLATLIPLSAQRDAILRAHAAHVSLLLGEFQRSWESVWAYAFAALVLKLELNQIGNRLEAWTRSVLAPPKTWRRQAESGRGRENEKINWVQI